MVSLFNHNRNTLLKSENSGHECSFDHFLLWISFHALTGGGLHQINIRAVIDTACIDESIKKPYRLSISKKAQDIDLYAN